MIGDYHLLGAVFLVVVGDDYSVPGHLDVEFASPEAGVLRCFERSDAVLGVASLLAVPISAMGHDIHM